MLTVLVKAVTSLCRVATLVLGEGWSPRESVSSTFSVLSPTRSVACEGLGFIAGHGVGMDPAPYCYKEIM